MTRIGRIVRKAEQCELKMADPVFPGSVAKVRFGTSDRKPYSAKIIDAPSLSRVRSGAPLTIGTDSDGNRVATTPTLDVGGVYVVEYTDANGTWEGSVEAATKLARRIGQTSGPAGSALLTVYCWGGVIVAGTDPLIGQIPGLSGFSSPNGAIYAGATGVRTSVATLVGRAPGQLDAALNDLENAWRAAARTTGGPTTSQAVSLLVNAGWTSSA